MSDKTGNPFILDVVGNTSEALINYVNFIADATRNPFFIDGPSPKIRLPALEQAMKIGLRERTIYNSIDYLASDEEISRLRELKLKNAVVMAFSPKRPLIEGRIEVLKGYENTKGLLKYAEEAGVENILVDTAVMDVPSIGLAARGIYVVKNEFGLPSGCGPANAMALWKRLRKGEFGPVSYDVCSGSSDVVTQMMGANFVLYGPVELAETAFSACAMCDAKLAYTAKRMGLSNIKSAVHPLYKIFKA
jgi:tetrahydromethanopterin S-methyltransferase subunit H